MAPWRPKGQNCCTAKDTDPGAFHERLSGACPADAFHDRAPLRLRRGGCVARLHCGGRRHRRVGTRRGGKVRRQRAGADQLDRRSRRRQGRRRRRAGPEGVQGRLPAVLRGGLARHRFEPGFRRPGPAEDRLARLRRDVGCGQRRLRALPGAVAGRDPRHGSARHRRTQADLSREARVGAVGGHHVPHRAAGRLRSLLAHDARRAEGRPLPRHRAEDLHHLGRPADDGEHRSPRARAAAGRAARHPGHLAVRRAEIQAERRRHAGRAERRAGGVGRAQDGHPRQPDLPCSPSATRAAPRAI